MTLAPGTRLGPYEVTAQIGVGGMGEVYRATDTKLKRQVAIKVLPASLAGDAERLARFQREAEVLASLNHPNIAGIYGLEDADGIKALVMELVEGPTLAERIAHGSLPIDEALPIAKQIAEALEAAHEQGIIHRDLKPANIKLRPDGTVKVLDFGLAKAMDPVGIVSPSISQSPTITTPAMTQAGMILGTAAYMSPEQARGKPVDKRADIWAFGCVLYEMLSGRRAFECDNVNETLAAVLHTQPDWNFLPLDTSAVLRRTVRLCLEKDAKQRVQAFGDVRLAMVGAFDTAEFLPAAAAGPAVQIWQRPLSISLLMVFAAVISVVTTWNATRSTAPPVVRFAILPPDGWTVPRAAPRVGRTNAADSAVALSPDGRRLAFIGAADGNSLLFVQALDSLTAQRIIGTEGASSPFWSPDGNSLGFFAADKLKKVDLVGGSPVTLCDAENPRGGTWAADTILFGTQGRGLHRISPQGGTPVPVTTLADVQTAHTRPYFLPDGQRFLFRAQTAIGPSPEWMRGPIYVGSLDSETLTTIIDSDSGNVQYSNGRLIYVRGTALLAQAFDSETLTLNGEPVQLAQGIEVSGNPPVAKFSVAGGNLAYRSGDVVAGRSSLSWFDRSGNMLGTVGVPELTNGPELAPDGRRVAVGRIDPHTNTSDLWVVAGAQQMRLTFDVASDGEPIWSPDGATIVFRSNRTGNNDLYRKSATGSGEDELLLHSTEEKSPTDWSRDGRFVLYESRDRTSVNIWALPMNDPQQPLVVVDTPFDERSAQFSPDGRWVAYVSTQSGPGEVYLRSFLGPAGQWQVSTAGGVQPRWSADGRELFYIASDGMLMAASLSVIGGAPTVGAATPLFQTRIIGGGTNETEYDLGADGRFLMNVPVEEGEGAVTPITIFLNWTAQ